MLHSRQMDAPFSRPTVGRRIALELRPARPLTWLGPAAAALCGAFAASGLAFSGETLLRVAIVVLLTDPILGAWRAAWVNTDWRRPMQGWQAAPTRAWMLVPYARLGSPAARFSQWLSSRARFWREAIVPHVGQAISTIVVSGLIACSVALVLGSTVFALTILALVLAPIESELGEKGAGQWARALAEITMPWVIGYAAVAQDLPSPDIAVAGISFAVVYRGLIALPNQPRLGLTLSNTAHLLVSILLILVGAALNAGILGLMLGAQVLWQASLRSGEETPSNYLARVQWFVLAAMAVAAQGLHRA